METEISSSQALQHQLEINLKSWRCVVTHGYSLLLWERSHDPIILGSVVTLIFGLIWYTDASVLTTFSLVAIAACLLDYLVPIISVKYLEPTFWKEGVDNVRYRDGITKMAELLEEIKRVALLVKETRANRPKIYFLVVFFSLLTFAWIGNLINNLFLTYLAVVTIVLLPGLIAHGYIKKVEQELRSMFGKAIEKVFPQKKKTK